MSFLYRCGPFPDGVSSRWMSAGGTQLCWLGVRLQSVAIRGQLSGLEGGPALLVPPPGVLFSLPEWYSDLFKKSIPFSYKQ